jgi:hypothetical protein
MSDELNRIIEAGLSAEETSRQFDRLRDHMEQHNLKVANELKTGLLGRVLKVFSEPPPRPLKEADPEERQAREAAMRASIQEYLEGATPDQLETFSKILSAARPKTGSDHQRAQDDDAGADKDAGDKD